MSADRSPGDRSPGHRDQRPALIRAVLLRAVLIGAGAIGGLLLAAVVAVNLVIYSGAPDGYETTPAELFREQPAVAVVVIVLSLALPVLGGWLTWRATR